MWEANYFSFSWCHNLEREHTDAFLHLGKPVCKVCNEFVIWSTVVFTLGNMIYLQVTCGHEAMVILTQMKGETPMSTNVATECSVPEKTCSEGQKPHPTNCLAYSSFRKHKVSRESEK